MGALFLVKGLSESVGKKTGATKPRLIECTQLNLPHPSLIKTTGDTEAALMRASDVIKSNLDPRAYAIIGFEMQKQLATETGTTVEQLLSHPAHSMRRIYLRLAGFCKNRRL